MKGRQNYICLRRLNEAAGIKDLFDDESEDLDKIFEWAKESSTGSKSDLSFMPTESIWTRVNSESDACMGMRCPYHNDCFVMKVRKEASSANIIVVNHHLLFADIESRMNGVGYSDAAVLPPYRRIIFDEAHGIESAATSFFSESLTRFKIGKLVGQMYRKRKNSETGHLCSMAVLSSNEEKAGLAYEVTTKIKNAIVNLELAARDILGTESTIRLYENTSRIFGPVLICINELAKVLGEFTNIIGLVWKELTKTIWTLLAFGNLK
jgi:ATP-dependent DNA helicase DinG